MNPSNYNTQHHHNGNPDYAAQRELVGRLAVLNGLIGNPVSPSTPVLDRNRIEQASLHGRHIRSKVFTAAIGKGYRLTASFISSLWEKRRQRYILRQNIAELRSLNDRTLRDIGVFPGDIAALAVGDKTAEEINQRRSVSDSTGVRLVSSKQGTRSGSDLVSGRCTALVDHAA